MAMDLSVSCHHCGADIGYLCFPDCSVNGKLIRDLTKISKKLNLFGSRIWFFKDPASDGCIGIGGKEEYINCQHYTNQIEKNIVGQVYYNSYYCMKCKQVLYKLEGILDGEFQSISISKELFERMIYFKKDIKIKNQKLSSNIKSQKSYRSIEI